MFDIKLNLKDLHQLPFTIDEMLDLTLHNMLNLDQAEFARKAVDTVIKVHKLVSFDARVEELLRQLKAKRDRPVDQAEVNDLLHFTLDDADESAQDFGDPQDDAGYHRDDPVRPHHGAAEIGQPGDHAKVAVNLDGSGAVPHIDDAPAAGNLDDARDGHRVHDANADRRDNGPGVIGGANGEPEQ